MSVALTINVRNIFFCKDIFLAYLPQACYYNAKVSADTCNGTSNTFQNMFLCFVEVPKIS